MFRSVVDDPGKFPALNIDSAGSNVELNPRLTSVTVFQSSIQLITRVKLPPNVKLWEPFSQLSVLSTNLVLASRAEYPPPEPAFRIPPGAPRSIA